NHVATERTDNRNFASRLFRGNGSRREPRHDHIDFELRQFGCQFGKTVDLSVVRSEFKPNVLSFDVTEVMQSRRKHLPKSLPSRGGPPQTANGPPLRLLRPRSGSPPDRRARNCSNKFAPPHCLPQEASGQDTI